MQISNTARTTEINRITSYHRDIMAGWLSSHRSAIIDRARTGVRMFDLCRDQQQRVTDCISAVSAEISDVMRVDSKKIMIYESGAYAKCLCVPASDIDLNFAYDEANFGRYFPFEKAVRSALSKILDMDERTMLNEGQIFASLAMSRVKDPSAFGGRDDLMQGASYWRRACRAVDNYRKEAAMKRASLRKDSSAGRRLFGERSYAAYRNPDLLGNHTLMLYQMLLRGDPRGLGVHDKCFIWGNESMFNDQISWGMRKDRADHFDTTHDAIDDQTIARLLFQLPEHYALRGWHNRNLFQISRLADFRPYLKYLCGFAAGYAMCYLFALSRAEEVREAPHSFCDFLDFEGELNERTGLGRVDTYDSINWLIAMRALVNIIATGGAQNPTLRVAGEGDNLSPNDESEICKMLDMNDRSSFADRIADEQNTIRSSICGLRDYFRSRQNQSQY